MQNWQKDRNYRKFKNEDGSYRYVIIIDGAEIEIAEDVYKAYSQADRRERYISECEAGLLLSLERMDEDGFQLGYLLERQAESAEDTVLRGMEQSRLMAALEQLTSEERALVDALFFRNISAREYAKECGVYHRAVAYRRDKILEKLRKLMAE
ncbi:RNA polymerase subunit sigma-70 [Tyzzerella sp. OttesenSCG-928-J15]|nr:RNA polymerase subunit sigma-70 [Tyzzerella sp. OttesenSCG-928-J15]